MGVRRPPSLDPCSIAAPNHPATQYQERIREYDSFAPVPTALYGVVLLMAAIAYTIPQRAILAVEAPDSVLHRALSHDLKGRISPLLYLAAIPLALLHPAIAGALYVAVALIWLVPDRRIERAVARLPANGVGTP